MGTFLIAHRQVAACIVVAIWFQSFRWKFRHTIQSSTSTSTSSSHRKKNTEIRTAHEILFIFSAMRFILFAHIYLASHFGRRLFALAALSLRKHFQLGFGLMFLYLVLVNLFLPYFVCLFASFYRFCIVCAREALNLCVCVSVRCSRKKTFTDVRCLLFRSWS